MKIKFQKYFELHKLKSNISEKNILEHIKNGKKLEDLIIGMPDEAFKEITNIYNSLIERIENIKNQIQVEFEKYKNIKDKKVFAISIKDSKYKSALFLLYNNNINKFDIYKYLY
jgi:hypothetical protein